MKFGTRNGVWIQLIFNSDIWSEILYIYLEMLVSGI